MWWSGRHPGRGCEGRGRKFQLRTVLAWLGGLIAVAALVGAGFATFHALAYDRSMARAYDVQAPPVQRSTDPRVVARGYHLAKSIGGCIACHGERLQGVHLEDFGPIARINAPNITGGSGGALRAYSDAQLARLLRHGIKADGRSVLFMDCEEFAWWPQQDVAALISWLRLQPDIDRPVPPSRVGWLGKVLDRVDLFRLDIARRIDHGKSPQQPPAPAPTAEYGAFLSVLCVGCHGAGLSGGPIPGSPPGNAVPTNLTPHRDGMAHYSEADFFKLLDTGIKPDGSKLDPAMPITSLRHMNDVEKSALYAYLRSLRPKASGQR